MRKLIILVALFLLLAAPAFAVDDTINVNVTIGEIMTFNVDAGPVTPTIEAGDIVATFKDIGNIGFVAKSNAAWTIKAKFSDFGTVYTDWGLTIDGDALNADNSTYVPLTAWTAKDPGTYSTNFTGNKITGLTWANCPEGSPSTTVSFTATQDP